MNNNSGSTGGKSSAGRRLATIIGIIVIVGLAVLAWAGLRPGPMDFAGPGVPLADYDGNPTGVPADFTGGTDLLARGKYLADAADCLACHTAEGGQAFAGGRAFVTEFGTIYSPNISPDTETGIGDWSDADILTTLHKGVAEGVPLYPAFPYAAYTYLTDDDVLAIKAYIFSQPAVRNTPPEDTLRFPYNQRWLMRIWAMLYNPDTRFEPVPDRSAAWNRGAYLVEALGHCGDCHTPRTPLQSLDNRRKFSGGYAEGWRAYNITSDPTSGLGSWSADDLERYLKTGRAENRGSAFGPMAEAVHLSFAKMTDSDLDAIVEYIQSIPAVATPDLPSPKMTPVSADPLEGGAEDTNPRGLEIFSSSCAGCHGWTGENDLVPHTTFIGSRAVNDPTATNVALAILHGASSLASPDGAVATMPAFGDILNDDDVAAVSNYVVDRFGAEPSSITAAQVHALREAQ